MVDNAWKRFFFLLARDFVIANPKGLETFSPLPYPISGIIEAISISSQSFQIISRFSFQCSSIDRIPRRRLTIHFYQSPYFLLALPCPRSPHSSEILSVDLFWDIYFFTQVLLPRVWCVQLVIAAITTLPCLL